MRAAPLQREEMDARHAARRPARAPRETQAPAIEPALELGDIVYVTFRGKPYGVPPVGWRLGLRLRTLWIEAQRYPSPLTTITAPKYHAVISQLPDLLWSHVRSVGHLRRLLRRVGLLANPFRDATEQELIDLAGFFLTRLTQSSIGILPMASRKASPSLI